MEYVNIFARPVNQHVLTNVLLCFRKKKDWQYGKFNLIGGKVKSGEKPLDAAVRELKEEAGLEPAVPGTERVFGHISGPWGLIHCVRITVPFDDPVPAPGEEEAQVVAWMDWREMANHELLVPNLRVILPLLSSGVEGWVVEDNGPTWETTTHSFKVSVKCAVNR